MPNDRTYFSGSLAEKVLNKKHMDWRFPDEYGLSERTLDCQQLAVHEVIKWKGEQDPFSIFISPFDCKAENINLIRSKPTLNGGWEINQLSQSKNEDIRHYLGSIIRSEGYALINYQAFFIPFCTYYQKFNIKHWSLVIDCDDTSVTLVDTAGINTYFTGSIGVIPWDILIGNWENSEGSIAILGCTTERKELNAELFYKKLAAESYSRMVTQDGLTNMEKAFDLLGEISLQDLTSNLERLELDYHYYRRLRELWKTAVLKKAVPANLIKAGWVEELFSLCKSWSLIMGVLMKWKRQPDRDYRKKLLAYSLQTLESERNLAFELKDW
ncbi:MAG: hypothetical protein ACQEXX_25090 [Bacillota bacterium]